MSYNISSWKTKKFDSLIVKISDLTKMSYITITLLEDNLVEAEGLCEGFSLEGKLDGDIINISEIHYSGEGSGSEWDNFKDMLEKTKGQLEVVQVWEGGEYITRLEVDDGSVIESEIEL